MRKLIIITLCLFSYSSYSKEILVKVNGMVCSMCAQGIQKKFSGLGELKDLKVDLDSKIVHISTHDHADIEDMRIKKLISEAGYNVELIERK